MCVGVGVGVCGVMLGTGSVNDRLVIIDCANDISFTETLALILSISIDIVDDNKIVLNVLLLRFHSIPKGSTIGCGCQSNIFLSTNTS